MDRVPRINHMAAYIKQAVRGKIIARKKYVTRNGQDMSEVLGWKWSD